MARVQGRAARLSACKNCKAGAHRLACAGGSLCQASVARHLGLQQVGLQLLSQLALALLERCRPRLHHGMTAGCTSHHALQPLLPLGISTGQLLLHSKHDQGLQAGAERGGRLQGWQAQASWLGNSNSGMHASQLPECLHQTIEMTRAHLEAQAPGRGGGGAGRVVCSRPKAALLLPAGAPEHLHKVKGRQRNHG